MSLIVSVMVSVHAPDGNQLFQVGRTDTSINADTSSTDAELVQGLRMMDRLVGEVSQDGHTRFSEMRGLMEGVKKDDDE